MKAAVFYRRFVLSITVRATVEAEPKQKIPAWRPSAPEVWEQHKRKVV